MLTRIGFAVLKPIHRMWRFPVSVNEVSESCLDIFAPAGSGSEREREQALGRSTNEFASK